MKHKFQLLKTSWGIVVFVDIEEVIHKKGVFCEFVITEDVSLKINWPSNTFKQTMFHWFSWAVRDVIEMLPKYDSLCFEVKEVLFNDVDFQEEGLYYAMQQWIAKKYQFELPELDAYYDREKNRYIFPSLSHIPPFP